MRFVLGAALGLLSSSIPVVAQTYTDCNPLQKTCPADPAFGQTDHTFDFTSGESSDFTTTGNVAYDSTNGATFTIAKQGDGPLIQSNWYIMFGRVDFQIKAASGRGIVSSAVMQSDDLDEIDWEWLGVQDAQVQTNYFGKGDTSSYNRGAFHDNPGNQDSFHTYSIDWTAEQIVWSIDGQTVRVLTPATADTNQYPQTPMMIKVGAWAGGDPNNAPGTIGWAGGETDYSQGPFTMYLKSLTVTDYSTGSSYSYSDMSGSWQSITSNGGQINGNSGAEPATTASAPAVTATVDSAPIPWEGTHRETSSFVTPNVWPWVATDSPTASASFPTGWQSSSGHVQPPRGGSVSEHTPAPSSPSLGPITKSGSFVSQSIFRSTSAPLVSSSAAFSRSGIETILPSTAPHASSTTLGRTTTKTSSKTTATEAATETARGGIATASPTNSSQVAPSKNLGINTNEVPAVLGSFCVLLAGILCFL